MTDKQYGHHSQRKSDGERLVSPPAERFAAAQDECQQQQTRRSKQHDEIDPCTVKPRADKPCQQEGYGSERGPAPNGFELRFFRVDDCVARERRTGADGVTRTLDLLFTKYQF